MFTIPMAVYEEFECDPLHVWFNMCL